METKSTSQPKKATELVVVHKESLNLSLEPSGESKQCKSSYLSKSKEVTCYNCRKKGHLVATCPEKHELNITSLGSKLNSSNSSSEVVNQGLENSSSCVMHLFLSKDVDSGHIMEYKDDKVKENVETQPHAAVQDQQQLTSKEEQTKNETVNHISFLTESLEANCDIPFFQSDLVSEKTCEKLTSLKPEQPSSIVCFSQVREENSPETTQRSSPLISELEPLTSTVSKPVLMPIPCDYPRMHCKEIDLVRKEPNLFVMVSAQDEKCFGLENVKEFRVSKSVFDKMIPTFETLTLEKFFKPKGFLFDEFRDFDSSLKVSLCSNAFELFRTKTENALVTTFTELSHLQKNELCESNMFNELCKMNDHVFEDHKLSCETNLAPVPPSEFIKLLQDVSIGKDHYKLQLDHSYRHHVLLFYDEETRARAKKKREQSDNKSLKELRAKDHREQLLEDNELEAKLPTGETLICLHQATSQSHIWRPGEYLRRSRPVSHEFWIVSLHIFSVESKMDLSSLCSVQTYQWRPGELSLCELTSRVDKLVTNKALIQEEPPDPTSLPFTVILTSIEHNKDHIQVSNSLTRVVSHVSRAVSMSLLYPEIVEKSLGLFKERSEQNYCLKMLVKGKNDKDNSWIRNKTCLLVYSDSMTVITHLFFAKAVENIAGEKEEPPDLEVLSTNVFERTGIGVVLTKELNTFQRTILVKMTKSKGRGFCDAEPLFKIQDNSNHSLNFRGKVFMFLYFDDFNLVLFVAGQTDLRTNLFQLGEHDVIMTSSKDLDRRLSTKEQEVIEHGAKEALEVPFGAMTRSRTRQFHHDFRALLQQVMTQEDHSRAEGCIRSTLVLLHARDN